MHLPPEIERELKPVPIGAETQDNFRARRIHSGQIAVSERPDAVSLALSLMAERYLPWGHAGIVVVEEGQPWVYEAFALMRPHLRSPPNADLGGGIRRISLRAFLKRAGYGAVYEPPAGVDRARLVAFAHEQLRRRTPFDGQFDATDSSRFYCTEFVARGLEYAGAATVPRAPPSRNRSVQAILRWMQIETDGLYLAGSLIETQHRVLLSAPGASDAQVAAYFAMKAELHRRFTPDQTIGSLISWTGVLPRMRPAVAEYFERGLQLPATDPAAFDADPVAAARALARKVFRIDVGKSYNPELTGVVEGPIRVSN